ncbi:MAG: spermidine/putrescine ABC transporter substrate-binding protein [Acidobacteria bacterium]|nr:MAG: spermidine/putrescine ABC transporter substrate-binding protein [Acidobacteriota bacterium]
MRRFCIVVAFALALNSACTSEQPTLHVYTWADYIKPELVTRFEKESACRLVIDTFDSNEAMYAKLKAGASGYDVVFPSSYMARTMSRQGMLRDLDRQRLPNLVHVDPEYLQIALDKDMKYSVPYMLTITGIAYLKSRVPNVEASWSVLDRADLKGRMTMLNDMRETVGAALKFLGYSLNTTNEQELRAARDVVIRWKKNLAKFENEQYKTGLASGEFLLVQGYSGDILQVQSENDDVAFAVPREGSSLACDDMIVLKDSSQVELAHRLINFLHDPHVAAENTEFIRYLCPNRPSYAYLTPETRSNPTLFPPTEVRRKAEVITDLGAENAKYTKVWDEIKAAE